MAGGLTRRLARWAAAHRGALATALVLPASFWYDQLLALRSSYAWTLGAAPGRHDERVRDVQAQVRRWIESGERRPMCTARPTWQTISTRKASYKRDCSRISVGLHDILAVDTQRRIVRVEPLVTMGQLTRHLLPLGWALAVMVEMEDLTAGGLTMGLGMETSSHRYGLIQETVAAYEVVLGDGSLVRATPTENADLFAALPWSHGTLGFLVAVELRIVPVKRFVRLRYVPCHSRAEYCRVLTELTAPENAPEFIEATIFSRDRAVVFYGDFADADGATPVNPINRWHKPWFYKHVESFLERGPGEELIPLRHYYHRHTRSIFWELQDMIPFGNHPLFRWTLGWLGAPKVSLIKLAMTDAGRRELMFKHVVQDIIIPMSELGDAVDRFAHWFGIYPLLVYPIRIYDHDARSLLRPPRHLLPGANWQMFVDLGAYGVPAPVRRGAPWDARATVRAMEEYTREVGGYQCLYADTFMTRDEFERMFDHTHYRAMRLKYHAKDAFPEIYDKVRLQYT